MDHKVVVLACQPKHSEAVETTVTSHTDPLDPSNSALYPNGDHWALFEELRATDPVHFTEESPFAPFWSVTRFDDIKQVGTSHEIFSLEPVIVIGDPPPEEILPQFIAMDQPRHRLCPHESGRRD